MLYIDLDGFKQVNTSGHKARYRLRVGVADSASRDFVLVCEQTDRTTTADIARRVTRSLSRPYPLSGALRSSQPGTLRAPHELFGQVVPRCPRKAEPGRVETFVPVPQIAVIRL